MSENVVLKLFISYSHQNEENIDEFRNHVKPLESNGLINNWFDRKIVAGKDFDEEIERNLDQADIICLFISPEYLASSACNKEINIALELNKKRGVSVIPIIVKPCGWKDIAGISKLLALPTDAKPISDYSQSADGWHAVYIGIKKVVNIIIEMKKLKFSKDFIDELNDCDLLTKAHSAKECLVLDDIYIHPVLSRYDSLMEYDKKISSEELIDELFQFGKIIIAGENQSGKTSLARQMVKSLRGLNFIPILISTNLITQSGKIENTIKKCLQLQYANVNIEEIDHNRIVPIIDDFHFLRNKEKHISELRDYTLQVILVDDIFSLDIHTEKLSEKYSHYSIREYSPSLRNQLIKKWIEINEVKGIKINGNSTYKRIDQLTEHVNTALGKVISSGIMPSYPFFIYSIISTFETFEKPLDQDITSQGYCYQALIFIFLRKQGVRNDEVDTYINYLTEFAFYLFANRINQLPKIKYEEFNESYKEEYNLPVKIQTLISKLVQTRIIYLDSLGQVSFQYEYLYYFFVAKHLADHCEEMKPEIANIINNLHVNENAYIAIFIAHHSKNIKILEEIILNSMCLFDEDIPSSLDQNELSFFDNQIDLIIQEALPNGNTAAETHRKALLEQEDDEEEFSNDDMNNMDYEEYIVSELRRSIKTVEVMGRILKNRAGSLKKDLLENVFEQSMKLNLRILSSFFTLIKEESEQRFIVEYIANRLEKIVEEADSKIQKEKLEKLARRIFWNLNFFVIYGIIDKTITSLGSDQLTKVIESVCDRENTPASFLIKHGSLMWYNKNLQIDVIAEELESVAYSRIAKKILRFMVVDFASMHQINYKDKQKIEKTLGIPTVRLLVENMQRKGDEQ